MTYHDQLVRSEINAIEPYNSGLSIEHVRQLYQPDQISKLGSNENPFGPSEHVLSVFKNPQNIIALYPDSSGNELRSRLALHLKAVSENIILGNGSEDLLSVISRTFLRNGDRIVTLFPSFPLHEDYATMMGASIDRVEVDAQLRIDVDALMQAASQPAKMLLFANPMNPVGAWLNPKDLITIIDATHPDTLIVLDEAYYEYAISGDYMSGIERLKEQPNPWIVLRTFSKAWGLAGLRIGYGLCSSPQLRAAMDKARTPFNVNAFAQAAALAALDDLKHMQNSIHETILERNRVEQELFGMGFRVAPSLGNFLFFEAAESAVDLAVQLLHNGVIVKPWKQQNYEGFVRVSIGTKAENNHFLSSLKSLQIEATNHLVR